MTKMERGGAEEVLVLKLQATEKAIFNFFSQFFFTYPQLYISVLTSKCTVFIPSS